MTVYSLDDQREDEQREDRGTYESTDDHRGERTLALTADAMTECGGQQARVAIIAVISTLRMRECMPRVTASGSA